MKKKIIKRNKTPKRQVIQMEAIAQHWLTDAQPVSEQRPLSQIPDSFTAEHDAIRFGISPGSVEITAVPVVLLSTFLCTPGLLAGRTVWKGLESM